MAGATRANLWALVLAGGDGTRLRDLTALITGAPIPKQYCRISGDRSMLEATFDRIRPLVPPERTVVVIAGSHVGIARDQLLHLPEENVLVQQTNRDTGPGILFSLAHLASRDPHGRIAVFPSDHFVGNDAAFRGHVLRADEIVARHPKKIALLGIQPDHPDPSLGYIEPARPLRANDRNVTRVAGFREKPCEALARGIIDRGGLWNSFVMLFRLKRVLDLLREVRPEEVEGVLDRNRTEATEAPPAWNFSSQFLALIPRHLVALRVDDIGWSDWGTREAIERTMRRMNHTPPWMHDRRVEPCGLE